MIDEHPRVMTNQNKAGQNNQLEETASFSKWQW